MKGTLTTILWLALVNLVSAQNYQGTSETVYKYNDQLERIQLSANDCSTVIYVDETIQSVVVKNTDVFTLYTALGRREENGIIKYDLGGDDGLILHQLEINTVEKTILFKPVPLISGSTEIKYSYK